MSGQVKITLDRSSRVPLYFQVAEQFEQAIINGTIASGDKIDNEVALANELGLSRPTMRHAIQMLVDKGMLVRKRGVGTQVVHGQVNRTVELTSLFDDLSAAGQQPHSKVMSLELVSASVDVAQELQVAAGDVVWSLERLRFVGKEPLALMRNYLPAAAIDLKQVDLAVSGLYASLRDTGILMRVARQKIGARAAGSRDARLLDEQRGAPLLTMQRTTYDDTGRAVEFGQHVYRAAMYTFEFTLVDR